ncbi:DotU family type IV/VI secretion system protein [Cysteiniphilum sp. 6C5]|uniref:DotU family type IV/VI secretion system protein n=1 Tax=unclassified Cysteiniphilum TaxID=2610889 RepID=UPI003F8309AB
MQQDFLIWKDISQLILKSESYGKEVNNLANVDIEETIETRAFFRNALHQIVQKVEHLHNAKIAKYTSFGIAVWLDEILSGIYEYAAHPWPSLQKELFETTEGGVKFYEYVDDVLANPFYPKFIYELYYCMLTGGFKGKYPAESERYAIANYINKLKEMLQFEHEKPLLESNNLSTPLVTKSRYLRVANKVKQCFRQHLGLILGGCVALTYLLCGVLVYF